MIMYFYILWVYFLLESLHVSKRINHKHYNLLCNIVYRQLLGISSRPSARTHTTLRRFTNRKNDHISFSYRVLHESQYIMQNRRRFRYTLYDKIVNYNTQYIIVNTTQCIKLYFFGSSVSLLYNKRETYRL